MNDTKRCSGYRGRWGCEKYYPDHIAPVEIFPSDSSSKDGIDHKCKYCKALSNAAQYKERRPRHPTTGEPKQAWKHRVATELGGEQGTTGWQSYLNKAEVRWIEEIEAVAWLGTIFPRPSKDDLPVSKPARKRVNTVYDKPLPKEGWVYIMDTYRYKKIGKTWENGLRARRTEARRWCPADLVYWAWFDDAKAAEAEIHRRLKRYKVEKENVGEELFDCTVDIAKDEINKLQEELENYDREEQKVG